MKIDVFQFHFPVLAKQRCQYCYVAKITEIEIKTKDLFASSKGSNQTQAFCACQYMPITSFPLEYKIVK